MFLVHLWNYIRGYVIIIAKGKSVERFINICTKRQILLWNIVRQDESSIICMASARGFKLMRPAARKSGCSVHILKKRGLPFFFKGFKKRKGFKAGLLVFGLLFVLFTSMIWEIEIKGCEEATATQIMELLRAEKVGLGSFKMKLDPRKIASQILIDMDDVAWAGVEIKGVKLTVSIESAVEKPDIVDYSQVCDLVAERDGLITGFEVLAGSTKIKEGDTVKAGQLLVAGTLEAKYPEFGTRNIHAMGRVFARTWYEGRLPVSQEYIQRLRTGERHENTYIRVLGAKIGLPGNRTPYDLYEMVSLDKTMAGPFGTKLPFGLTVETYYEIKEKVVQLTREEAEDLAKEQARQKLLSELPADIRLLDEKVSLVTDDSGKEYVEIILECEEDIAKPVPIGGD
jgi:similar to stage IV sporulation protein